MKKEEESGTASDHCCLQRSLPSWQFFRAIARAWKRAITRMSPFSDWYIVFFTSSCCHVGLDAWTVGAIFECRAEFKLSGAMGLLFCPWMSCRFPAPFVFLRLFAKNYGIARGQTNQSAKFKKSLIWLLHFKNVWQNSIKRNRCSWWRKLFLLFRISNNYHNHNKIRSKLNHIMNYLRTSSSLIFFNLHRWSFILLKVLAPELGQWQFIVLPVQFFFNPTF